jgi:hypothetical protein
VKKQQILSQPKRIETSTGRAVTVVPRQQQVIKQASAITQQRTTQPVTFVSPK